MCNQQLQLCYLQLPLTLSSLSAHQQLLALIMLLPMLLLPSTSLNLAQQQRLRQLQKPRHSSKLRLLSCRLLPTWLLQKHHLLQFHQQIRLLLWLQLLLLLLLLLLQSAMRAQLGWITSSRHSRRGSWGSRCCLLCSQQVAHGVGVKSRQRRQACQQHCRACRGQQLQASCSRLLCLVC
jgi:hypothetical protein